jgi:hypothetical protein
VGPTVFDPWLSLAALNLTLLGAPALPAIDPGPSPRCPNDMRLVEGRHYDTMQHLCIDPRKGIKDTHCYAYAPGYSVLEGPTREIAVCMDQFEAPNKRGHRPLVMASYRSAARWCAKRGKRLCDEREWETACEGPEHRALAYGWSVNVRRCNSNKAWKQVNFHAFGGDLDTALAESKRLWQGSQSGRYASCVSSFGIFDMMGNVEEWVTSRETRTFPGSLMGGFWAKPWTGCRGTNDAHEPTFAFYETGFRCCKDPEPLRAEAVPPDADEAPAAASPGADDQASGGKASGAKTPPSTKND